MFYFIEEILKQKAVPISDKSHWQIINVENRVLTAVVTRKALFEKSAYIQFELVHFPAHALAWTGQWNRDNFLDVPGSA